MSAVNARDGVSCQTSGASPIFTDVTEVIDIRGQGGVARRPTARPATASRSSPITPPRFQRAVRVDSSGSALSCADVAGYANQIQQDCESGGLAGGTYSVNAGKRVEVMHS